MEARPDIQEIENDLQQAAGRLKLMIVDAKKTGLAREETKKGILSDLQRRFEDTQEKLAKVKVASEKEEEAEARRELEEAWATFKVHFDRIERGPSD